MYIGRPFLQIFLFFKKAIIAVIAMYLALALRIDNMEHFPISGDNVLATKISVLTAVFVALLNAYQVICVFIELNQTFKIIYLISCFLSNTSIIVVSAVNLRLSPAMYLGIFAGSLGLLLLLCEFYKKQKLVIKK
ncbi:hypothetical protein DSM07_02305 [Oenococcus sp. UCMA 16435]|nr:hypothetical protein DSM07_02305 [Oenococcus sp. UCMA 16435]MDI4584264.1 hypothetical protein [Oenococcus sp. UCMA 14587]